jgi:UDPglucose--hexose-1-phosphate uridylyltransferase
VRRTAARLADGREIIYFDHDGAAPRVLDDPRELPPRPTGSELRYDPLVDEWVAIASHRQTRTHLPATADCPLCPSRDGRHTEIPSADYDVVVFENRFPALAGPSGRCEVVCFTSDHTASFASLTPAHARLVIDAWADRTAELGALPGVEQVYCFENRGEEIGVTLHHPHGQVYAYPFITPRTRQMLGVVRARPGVFASVLEAERAGPRVVCSSEHWTAFVPEAARWPVEVRVFPHRKVPDLPALDAAERDDLAGVYLDVLRRMDRLYGAPLPYIAAWHQAPARADRELWWLHLQLFSIRRAPGRLKYLAGTEAGMGAFSNDVLPEGIAARLRAAMPSGSLKDS